MRSDYRVESIPAARLSADLAVISGSPWLALLSLFCAVYSTSVQTGSHYYNNISDFTETLQKMLADMLWRTEVWLAVLLIIAALLFFKHRAGQRLEPPGPWGLPIVGYLPFLGMKMNLTFSKLAKRYGDVFQLRIGSRKVVVISGQKSIRKALVENTTVFAGRPNFYTYVIQKNFWFADFSPSYRVYKKHTMKAMGQFKNVRRDELQQVAHNAVLILLKAFKVAKNQPTNPVPVLYKAVCTIMGYICYGNFFDGDSEEVTTILAKADKFAEFGLFGYLIDFMPWMGFMFRKRVQRYEEMIRLLFEYSDKLASAHIQEYDGKTMRDVCDMFRKVAEDMDEDEQRALNINDEILKRHISSLFGAGFGTIAYTLQYGIMIMALNPDIQKQVQDEIDAVVGRDRFPEFGDEARMPYTVATITEIYRHHSLSALGLAHSTTCDTEFEGYFIPKNTPVIFSLYSANYDKTIFSNPEKFDPERFLTDTGTVNTTHSELVVPYSLGQRRCAGEPVARSEIFVFFATILHQCTIEQAPGHPLDTNNYFIGFALQHYPIKVIFRSRNGDW